MNFLHNSCGDGKKVCGPLAGLHTLAESNLSHIASLIDATVDNQLMINDQRSHWLMTNEQSVALSFVFLFMIFHGSAKPHERRIASF